MLLRALIVAALHVGNRRQLSAAPRGSRSTT